MKNEGCACVPEMKTPGGICIFDNCRGKKSEKCFWEVNKKLISLFEGMQIQKQNAQQNVSFKDICYLYEGDLRELLREQVAKEPYVGWITEVLAILGVSLENIDLSTRLEYAAAVMDLIKKHEERGRELNIETRGRTVATLALLDNILKGIQYHFVY